MTPSERERRVKAAAKVIFGFASPTRWDTVSDHIQEEYCRRAAEALDAADEAVPVVSEAEYSAEVNERVRLSLNVTRDAWEAMERRAGRAEAAAKEFARALRRIAEPRQHNDGGTFRRDIAQAAVRDHPSFSGEEGTGT